MAARDPPMPSARARRCFARRELANRQRRRCGAGIAPRPRHRGARPPDRERRSGAASAENSDAATMTVATMPPTASATRRTCESRVRAWRLSHGARCWRRAEPTRRRRSPRRREQRPHPPAHFEALRRERRHTRKNAVQRMRREHRRGERAAAAQIVLDGSRQQKRERHGELQRDERRRRAATSRSAAAARTRRSRAGRFSAQMMRNCVNATYIHSIAQVSSRLPRSLRVCGAGLGRRPRRVSYAMALTPNASAASACAHSSTKPKPAEYQRGASDMIQSTPPSQAVNT